MAQVFIGARQKHHRCSAKASSVLGKRIIGAQQKNRRCSAKESSVLSKRIDDAKRKQSIYFKKSLNCYASLGSKAGLNKSAFRVFPLESSVTVWVVVAGPIDSSKEKEQCLMKPTKNLVLPDYVQYTYQGYKTSIVVLVDGQWYFN